MTMRNASHHVLTESGRGQPDGGDEGARTRALCRDRFQVAVKPPGVHVADYSAK
jgi:hypothetical protein